MKDWRAHLWKDSCQQLKIWVADHAGALPLSGSSDAKERVRARWLDRQGKKIRKGSLGNAQTALLAKIPGMPEKIQDWKTDSWENHCRQLEQWVADHDEALPVSASSDAEEKALARWIVCQAESFRKGSLGDAQLALLAKIPGMSKEIQDWRMRVWEDRCGQLEQWLASNGGSLPSPGSSNVVEKGWATWISRQSKKFRHGRLSEAQLAALRKLPGMPARVEGWATNSASWDAGRQLLQQWVDGHDGVLPSHRNRDVEEKRLGFWIKQQGKLFRNGRLNESQMALLKQIPGMAKHMDNWSWEGRCQQLQQWVDEHDGVLPVHGNKGAGENCLGQWMGRQRKEFRRGCLDNAKLSRLAKIPGMSELILEWKIASWELHCKQFERLLAGNDGKLPRPGSGDAEQNRWARWLRRIEKKHGKGALDDSQIRVLANIPGMQQRIIDWRLSSAPVTESVEKR
eukprot:TRINITY_DN31501_c0_g1_i1.p1 TRINITY_DN31501_c0_g1~~TRINITY_DN31501_c0_g1_i1.p1  ORF type:complete len:456 (-),score=95.45 TRINITY_DN31501_c0_g1_i1:129-1496(-)